MAIFITKLALRRAPIATTTARGQCRGLKIRRPMTDRGQPYGSRDPRYDAAMKHHERIAALSNGDDNESSGTSASGPSIHKIPTLRIRHSVVEQPVKPRIAAEKRRDLQVIGDPKYKDKGSTTAASGHTGTDGLPQSNLNLSQGDRKVSRFMPPTGPKIYKVLSGTKKIKLHVPAIRKYTAKEVQSKKEFLSLAGSASKEDSFFLGSQAASTIDEDDSPRAAGGSIHDVPSPTSSLKESELLGFYDEPGYLSGEEFHLPASGDEADANTAGMFKPTSPRQAKSSTRRHLTPDILSELLGEPSAAAPVKSSIPPLNLTPESVGLPPDVSWRPLADKDQKSFLHSDHVQNGTPSPDPLVSRLRDTATVLVLSCASRTLALSDFIRLSPQGEHIEGWTSGIVRVIPGRNPTTLERLNHYFLVFSTSAAAAGYAENLDRLHKLSQKWTPDRPQHLGTPTPGLEIGTRGEDVGALVRSYTLLPNTQPRVHIRRMQKPYRPAIARVIETGAYHNVLAQEKDKPGENLVLFQLDNGLMSGNDLMKVIEADGRRRNLNWRLEGNSDGDILQYGGGGKNDASRSEDDWEDVEGVDRDNDKSGRKKRKDTRDTGLYPRHIVRFKDAVEAKRFVRAWHCRILEGEPWDTLAAKSQWAGGKVGAEILW